MNRIWGKIRFYTVSVRVTSGTSQRCGAFVFNKATRVAINAYSINLPVIASSGYPKCGVGMYMRELAQPREPGVTYIYAHARTGMFLPLLNASKVNNGAAMIGKLVRVYTTDNRMVTYQIDRVRRHVSSIQNALGITTERLWLQTSEGPNFTYPKLVIEAQAHLDRVGLVRDGPPHAAPVHLLAGLRSSPLTMPAFRGAGIVAFGIVAFGGSIRRSPSTAPCTSGVQIGGCGSVRGQRCRGSAPLGRPMTARCALARASRPIRWATGRPAQEMHIG